MALCSPEKMALWCIIGGGGKSLSESVIERKVLFVSIFDDLEFRWFFAKHTIISWFDMLPEICDSKMQYSLSLSNWSQISF